MVRCLVPTALLVLCFGGASGLVPAGPFGHAVRHLLDRRCAGLQTVIRACTSGGPAPPTIPADAHSRRAHLRHVIGTVAAAFAPTIPAQAAPAAPAIAAVVPGFLIPPEQYEGYCAVLRDMGIPAVVVDDGSTLGRPTPIQEAAATILAAVETAAAGSNVAASAPLVLVAHSRGGKSAVLAAQASQRDVAAIVLLDPVDATGAENSTALPALRSLRAPLAVLGAGAGAGECAPPGANYAAFFAAAAPAPPRLLALLPRAGHTQLLDDRAEILDVCSPGKAPFPCFGAEVSWST